MRFSSTTESKSLFFYMTEFIPCDYVWNMRPFLSPSRHDAQRNLIHIYHLSPSTHQFSEPRSSRTIVRQTFIRAATADAAAVATPKLLYPTRPLGFFYPFFSPTLRFHSLQLVFSNGIILGQNFPRRFLLSPGLLFALLISIHSLREKKSEFS